MQLLSIASGSSGNCIFVGDKKTKILIDAGISGKKIEEGLLQHKISPNEINGLLITHEHSDHIKGAGIISRRYKIPIYATKVTWEEIMSNNSIGKIDKSLYREVIPDNEFLINDFLIYPFRTSHDAVDPVCYTFSKDNYKISIATDLGSYNDYIKEVLKDSSILFIEANHDIKMLEVGNYPYFLKQRILSDIGHLSNDSSGRLISELLHKDLDYIVLGHLSNENNFPDLALETVYQELSIREDIKIPKERIYVAKRSKVSRPIILEY